MRKQLVTKLIVLFCSSLLLMACQRNGNIQKEQTTSADWKMPPTIPREREDSRPTETPRRIDTPIFTPVSASNSCDQVNGEAQELSLSDLSYLLFTIQKEGGYQSKILDLSTNSYHLLPAGLVPLAWSPSGDSLLLADGKGPNFYLADRLGNSQKLVFSLETGQAEHWGWWLSDHEIIVPERKYTNGETIAWQYYLVDIDKGEETAFDPNVTWQIYDVAQNGGFWVEKGRSFQLVFSDGHRINLWEEGDIITEISPRPAYVSIFPNGCGVVFVGCSGDRALGDRKCSIYSAQVRSGTIKHVTEVYSLEDDDRFDSIKVSRDSKYVAFFSSLEKMLILRLDNNELERTYDLHPQSRSIPEFVWGPTANLIAVNFDSIEGEITESSDIQRSETIILTKETGINLVEWRSFDR